jgi:hypothetical protein
VRMCDEIYFIDKEVGMLEKGSSSHLLTADTKTYEYFEKQLV